jgi:hypothetical protein
VAAPDALSLLFKKTTMMKIVEEILVRMQRPARMLFVCLALSVSCLSMHAVGSVKIYVDPQNGNDTYPGSLEQPIKTIVKAQELVRAQNMSMTDNIYVYLRGGEYNISSTLNFSNLDGGKDGHWVIYKSYGSEKPVISGGLKVSNWTQVPGKKYYVTDLNTVDHPSFFRYIWVNGRKAVQARSKWFAPYPMMYDDPSTSQPRDGFVVKSSDVKMYTNPQDVKILMHGEFKHVELALSSESKLTEKENILILKQPSFFSWTRNHKFRLPNVIRVLNALEELDEPGEFYVDRTTWKLYYYPRTDDNMATATSIIPSADVLVKLMGDASASLRNLQFEGIAFEYGNLLALGTKEIGRSQADLYSNYQAIEGQIQLQYTKNITFRGCRFEHFGSSGIYLINNNDSTLIEGNILHDMTAAAILVGKDGSRNAAVNNHTNIRNNVIRDMGSDFYQASGIYANSSKNMTISHNDVADVAYFGINQRYSGSRSVYVGNTVIDHNRVSNFVTACRYGLGIHDESAGIYLFGTQDSRVNDNYVEYKGSIKVREAYRQDQSSINNTWENNVSDCKKAQCSFSYHPSQPYEPLHYNNNYANLKGGFPVTTPPAVNTNFHLESNAPAWSSAAQAIIDSAGLQAPYKSLLSEFGADVYGSSEIPSEISAGWSDELQAALIKNRHSFTYSTYDWRGAYPSSSVNATIIGNNETKISGPVNAMFLGGIFGNETVKMKMRLEEKGTGKQTIYLRLRYNHCYSSGNYSVEFTPSKIVARRNSSPSVVLASIDNNTKIYGSEPQLVEITTTNVSNGVHFKLAIAGKTLIDAVDSKSGYVTHEGFMMVCNTDSGNVYISSPHDDAIIYTGNETAEEMTKDADGTYHITTAGNLRWLQNVCSSSSTYTQVSGKTYKLMNDVEITASNWTPIGTYMFAGSFDGNGKTVRGLKCVESTDLYAGFFGRWRGGTLKALTVEGLEVSSSAVPTSGSRYVRIGGIVGEIDSGSIIGCCAQIDLLLCTVSLYGIGGIVGYVGGNCTIEGCISNCGAIEPNNYKSGTNCGGVIGTIAANTFVSVISCVSDCKKITALYPSGTSSRNLRGGVIGGCGRGTTGSDLGKVTLSQCWYVKSGNSLYGINTAIGCVNLQSRYTIIDDVENQWGSVATDADLDAKVAALNQAIKDNGDEAVVRFVSGLSLSYDVQTSGIVCVKNTEKPDVITMTPDGIRVNYNGILSIYSVDGRLLYDISVTLGETVALDKGIYIVKTNNGKQLYSVKCVKR